MLESEADRLAILKGCDGELGLIGNDQVWGVFTDEHAPIDLGGQIIESTAPEFLCRSSDVTDVVTGIEVKIRGVSYTVSEIQPDGTGMTTLRLHE